MTDGLGQTATERAVWLRWGPGVTRADWRRVIVGYSAESPHVPYLLDPIYERYGMRSRLWFSEAGDCRDLDPNRMAASVWTTHEEWGRPAWVHSGADVRVRLRFALLAAATAVSDTATRGSLRTLSLEDLDTAAGRMERIVSDCRLRGQVPQTVCLAAVAVRSAAAVAAGRPALLDLVARHYSVAAWYAAMAAACACVPLSEIADEAVRQEFAHGMAMTGAMELAMC